MRGGRGGWWVAARATGAGRRLGVAAQPLINEELVFVERGRSKGILPPIPFARLKDHALVLPSRRHGIRSIVDSAAEKLSIEITQQGEIDALSPTLILAAVCALPTGLPTIVATKSTTEHPLQPRRIIQP